MYSFYNDGQFYFIFSVSEILNRLRKKFSYSYKRRKGNRYSNNRNPQYFILICPVGMALATRKWHLCSLPPSLQYRWRSRSHFHRAVYREALHFHHDVRLFYFENDQASQIQLLPHSRHCDHYHQRRVIEHMRQFLLTNFTGRVTTLNALCTNHVSLKGHLGLQAILYTTPVIWDLEHRDPKNNGKPFEHNYFRDDWWWIR